MRQTGETEYAILAEHDGMFFVFIKDAMKHNTKPGAYLGFYIDNKGNRQRIIRGSVYGLVAKNELWFHFNQD